MLRLFAVMDIKAAAYGRVLEAPTVGLAARSFVDACGNPNGPLAQHPEDYVLHEIGSWDPATGAIQGLPQPIPVMTAAAGIAQARKERFAARDAEVKAAEEAKAEILPAEVAA